MVLISRADDHLKVLSKNDWQPDPGHPDVDPVNEAAKLADLFERSVTLADVISQPSDFRQWLQDARAQSAVLRDAVSGLAGGTASADEANQAYKTLAASCNACHDAYRN